MTKIPQNGKIPKNGVFREIPQNWDFGGHDDEHTRKAWYGNYFKNNPWVSILHTSIGGVYFTLFVSHWFSVNFILDYFYRVEENVIKWKKMVVDVQNEVFYGGSIDYVEILIDDQYNYVEMINKILWRFYGEDQ